MTLLPAESDLALKEWAVAIRALGSGKQVLILRKGGIHKDDKEFRVVHPEFLLYPTYEHQNAELIKEAFARLDALALGIALGLVGGVGLFLATALLLLKGGPMVGLTLSLLGHYLPGFAPTWTGAFVGLVEAGIGGFVLGYLVATLRNWGMMAYAHLVKRRADAAERRDLLDRV